jgi:hypothetical protein
MNFSEFDDYAGLFAEQGDFDIPENWNLGVSWQATPQLRLGRRLPAHQFQRCQRRWQSCFRQSSQRHGR